ncbi:MAG: class I SAM-dependent methyltransferase [Flavobacteriales bacterium]
MPAEGEGRNAVYAAQQGWEVTAFDISESGRSKAMHLATEAGVQFTYHVGTLEEIPALRDDFDAIGLVFTHFPTEIRARLCGRLLTHLRPGGSMIFEAFAKEQLWYQQHHQSGGPQLADMLFSVDEVRSELPGVAFSVLEEVEVRLDEGPFHQGLAKVVRGAGVRG